MPLPSRRGQVDRQELRDQGHPVSCRGVAGRHRAAGPGTPLHVDAVRARPLQPEQLFINSAHRPDGQCDQSQRPHGVRQQGRQSLWWRDIRRQVLIRDSPACTGCAGARTGRDACAGMGFLNPAVAPIDNPVSATKQAKPAFVSGVALRRRPHYEWCRREW